MSRLLMCAFLLQLLASTGRCEELKTLDLRTFQDQLEHTMEKVAEKLEGYRYPRYKLYKVEAELAVMSDIEGKLQGKIPAFFSKIELEAQLSPHFR